MSVLAATHRQSFSTVLYGGADDCARARLMVFASIWEPPHGSRGAHSTVVSLPPSFRGVLGSMYVRVLCSFGMPLLTMAKVLSWEH